MASLRSLSAHYCCVTVLILFTVPLHGLQKDETNVTVTASSIAPESTSASPDSGTVTYESEATSPENKHVIHIYEHDIEHEVGLVGWRFEEVGGFLTVALFFLSACLAKIAYHNLDFLHYHVPESCVLIILGTVIGLLFHAMDYKEHLPFKSEDFLFILLPPIILESAYSLHDKAFFYNFKTILLYAVVGTLINVFLIGGSLYGLERMGFFDSEISLIECFTFSTIISAVDPVAVLAIFHEIGVNKPLYFLVFGESLLNDAVVIVLYGTVTTFAAMPSVSFMDFVMGIMSFFTVSGGGFFTGILIGGLTAVLTKTTEHVRVVEPFLVIVLAYLSYVAAELFHFSGIISLIACGLVQYQYIADNISADSLTTIKYFVKTMSSISDVIIFFYLGRVLVRDDHTWNSSFVFFSTFFCVVYRFFSTFLLTAFANRFMQSLKRITLGEQFIMAYGGKQLGSPNDLHLISFPFLRLTRSDCILTGPHSGLALHFEHTAVCHCITIHHPVHRLLFGHHDEADDHVLQNQTPGRRAGLWNVHCNSGADI
jgi:NhaP-type Na+/H+ or K+/H+ antiporter